MTPIGCLNTRLVSGAIALLMLSGGGPAFAQSEAPAHAPRSPQVEAARHAMREACEGDIASFCADASKGHGGVRKCLKAHEPQLSPGCASAGEALRDARHAQG